MNEEEEEERISSCVRSWRSFAWPRWGVGERRGGWEGMRLCIEEEEEEKEACLDVSRRSLDKPTVRRLPLPPLPLLCMGRSILLFLLLWQHVEAWVDEEVEEGWVDVPQQEQEQEEEEEEEAV